MTRDELRDRLKELVGWRQEFDRWDNQFPDNDLTALAAAWPEDLDITIVRHRRDGETWRWNAWCTKLNIGIDMPHPHAEYDARLALTVAVLEHERGAGNTLDAGRGEKS